MKDLKEIPNSFTITDCSLMRETEKAFLMQAVKDEVKIEMWIPKSAILETQGTTLKIANWCIHNVRPLDVVIKEKEMQRKNYIAHKKIKGKYDNLKKDEVEIPGLEDTLRRMRESFNTGK